MAGGAAKGAAVQPRRGKALRIGAAVAAAVAAIFAIVTAVVMLEAATRGLVSERFSVDGTPVTVLRPAEGPPAPAVVIAHGFAGSRQLMAPIAVSLAQNGYVAVSFDSLGHGRNPAPLAGDVTQEDGATVALQAELARIVAAARQLPYADGRIAVLGHSMAADIIVREAIADPEIRATVAISMFSRQVTADAPRNLLMIVGAWEGFLIDEAVAMLRLAAGPAAQEGATFGQPSDGSARRLAVADGVEHVGVLYSRETLGEAVAWLNGVFGRQSAGALDNRAPWLGLLFGGVIALAWPLASCLPRIARYDQPPALTRGQLVAACLGPMILTPLILWPFDISILPVLVADYLAVHFLVYGALILTALAWLAPPRPRWPSRRLILCALGASAYAILAVGLPLDRYVVSFMPTADRIPVILALATGALAYALAEEWLIRRQGAPVWLPALSKLCLVVSLGIATALDLEALFFLIIILPVIVLFVLVYGTMSGWVFRATGHPTVWGLATGLAFGWALGVTFPMLAN